MKRLRNWCIFLGGLWFANVVVPEIVWFFITQSYKVDNPLPLVVQAFLPHFILLGICLLVVRASIRKIRALSSPQEKGNT
ncbi:MAG TPA: hypothetical protein VJ742_12515 [Nitrososphaera sp.]|nr:hypothetical protein [Nitrososphaera sp.]